MRIAAIVVADDSAQELPHSLGCLGAFKLDRIVVVDNSSTDTSVEVARAYTPDVISLPKVGFGAAINAAVARVPDMDAYFLLNPGGQLTERDFATLVTQLRTDLRLGAVAPVTRYPSGRFGVSAGPAPSMAKEWLAALGVDHLVPRPVRRLLVRQPWLRARIRMLDYADLEPTGETRVVDWVSDACLLVRAEAFQAVEGFDARFLRYFQDVDLCQRLRHHGWLVASVGASVAEREESTSAFGMGKNRLHRRDMVVYFTRHGTLTQQLLARLLRWTPR